jgi:hypothetical protein
VAQVVRAPRELIEDACQTAWATVLRAQPNPGTVFARSKLAGTLLCALLLAQHVRAFETRPDFAAARRAALVAAESDSIRVFEWLLAHHQPTDVALASDRDGSFLCAPSGTKAVCAGPGFSNPYVDLGPRRIARDRMFDALDRDDSAAFQALAGPYHVTHVITTGPRSRQYDARLPVDLELGFRSGPYRVFLLKLPRDR